MVLEKLQSIGMFVAGVGAGKMLIEVADVNPDLETFIYSTLAGVLLAATGKGLAWWKCKPLEDDTALMELANRAVQEIKKPNNLPRALYTLSGLSLSPFINEIGKLVF